MKYYKCEKCGENTPCILLDTDFNGAEAVNCPIEKRMTAEWVKTEEDFVINCIKNPLKIPAFEPKHLLFIEGPPKPKTKTWWVVNKYDDIQLGWIGWFTKWQKYGFFPKPDTVYEEDCLRDIAYFCENETKKHKDK